MSHSLRATRQGRGLACSEAQTAYLNTIDESYAGSAAALQFIPLVSVLSAPQHCARMSGLLLFQHGISRFRIYKMAIASQEAMQNKIRSSQTSTLFLSFLVPFARRWAGLTHP